MFTFEQDLHPSSTLNLAILEELPVSSTHLLTVTANASLGLSDLAHAISGTVLWHSVLRNTTPRDLRVDFSPDVLPAFPGRIYSIFAIRHWGLIHAGRL
jgi:hypothetical protein